MPEKLEFVKSRSQENVGHHRRVDTIIARGDCPFCNAKASFRQIASSTGSEVIGENVPVKCDGCQSFAVISISNALILPAKEKGLSELPEQIENPYNEAITCMEAGANDAACTMWRKVVQAVCVYYDVTDTEDDAHIYQMINDLADEGHITENHRKGLLAVKDIGNDGAHINENNPDEEQAEILRDIVDSLLNATVVAEQYVEEAREIRPNDHAE